MKRIALALLVLVLIIGTLGCQPADKTEEKTTEEKTTEETSVDINLTFASGTSGGTLEVVAQGIAEAVRKTYPSSVITVIPGGTVANIQRVSSGEADIGIAYTSDVKAAHGGNEPFTEKYPGVRIIAATHATVAQHVIRKGVGYDSLTDIVENKYPLKVGFHAKGTGPEFFARKLFEFHGADAATLESWGGKWVNPGPGDAANLLKDGQLDSFERSGGLPDATIMELAINHDITLLKYDPETIKEVCEEFGYVEGTIKAGTYTFLKEDVATLVAPCVIVVDENLPDEVAYALAKSLHEQLDYMKLVHASVKEYQSEPDALVNGLFAFHPGAEKYFKEVGLLK